eukprot:COSAG06_NODE_571_length_14101_cov_12.481682_2_plen_69_part_00
MLRSMIVPGKGAAKQERRQLALWVVGCPRDSAHLLLLLLLLLRISPVRVRCIFHFVPSSQLLRSRASG